MKLKELLAEAETFSDPHSCFQEPVIRVTRSLARRLALAVDELQHWCPNPTKSFRDCECRVCVALRKIEEPE